MPVVSPESIPRVWEKSRGSSRFADRRSWDFSPRRLLGDEGGVTFVSRRGGVGRGLLEVREVPALAASATAGFGGLRPGAVGLTWKGFDMTGNEHLTVLPPGEDAFGTDVAVPRAGLSWGFARQARREGEAVAARGQVAGAADRIRAGLAAGALANMASLTGMAARAVQTAPEGAPYYEAIVRAYGVGAARMVARFE